MDQKKECSVIGAGIVGICCGIALQDRGYQVTLYDSETPGSMTSRGNAGGFGFTDVMPMAAPGVLWKVPGWLFDPCGPLFIRPGHFPSLFSWLVYFQKVSSAHHVERLSGALSSLLEPSKRDSRELISRTGLQDLFTEKGALTVYKTRESFENDRLEWTVKAKRGVEVQELGPNDIRAMEPELQNARFGWYTPQWCNTTDPFEVARKQADYFVEQGGRIVSSHVRVVETLELAKCSSARGHVRALILDNGESVAVDQIVIAAGVWSKQICRQLGERVLLESERGYNTTLPNPGVTLEHQVIFGEEKFVITNIQDGLRIGGAAEFAGLKTPANYKRSEKLLQIARRYLPSLNDAGCEQWMGHRPSTPDSIPVIGKSLKFDNIHYAFGHGHYGLTMAATTGKLVAQSMLGEKPDVDLEPFSISRFS